MNERTKKIVRDRYREIRLFKSIMPTELHPERIREHIHECKMEIRKAIKVGNRYDHAREFASCDRFIYYKDDGQEVVDYRKYKTDMSREEMAEWCREYWEDNQVRSMYDCTGQRFVSSIRFAHMRDNIYLVRITWGLDV